MIRRRQFIAYGCVLASSGITMGHSRQDPTAFGRSGGKSIGPPSALTDNIEAIGLQPYSPRKNHLRPDRTTVDNLERNGFESLSKPLDEVVVSDNDEKVSEAALIRLAKLQSYVGYANFNVIDWDRSLRIAKDRQEIGEFTRDEMEFVEKLFYTGASNSGFYGHKLLTRLSSTIATKDIVKIAGTGHYLFNGKASDTYHRIRKDVGESIVLTSGVRGVVKQIYLFLRKAASVGGNLSLASNSVAPPGRSYHALGDFDVGKTGWGHKNFSAEFADTDEFQRLLDLGYIDIRYPKNNSYGVRYEPWHIKIV